MDLELLGFTKKNNHLIHILADEFWCPEEDDEPVAVLEVSVKLACKWVYGIHIVELGCHTLRTDPRIEIPIIIRLEHNLIIHENLRYWVVKEYLNLRLFW